jgi:hypothetical protein
MKHIFDILACLIVTLNVMIGAGALFYVISLYVDVVLVTEMLEPKIFSRCQATSWRPLSIYPLFGGPVIG